MIVVIDFRGTYKISRAMSVFTRALWEEMAARQPLDQFIFFSGNTTPAADAASNITVQQTAKTGMPWLDRLKMAKTLKKIKADRLVTITETGFLSRHIFQQPLRDKKTSAEQEIRFAGNAEVQPKKKSLAATAIAMITPACGSIVTTLSWPEAESIKTQYTGGRSFFLFTGNISEQHQLVDLLKAFSSFKKWQQSNMQLVLAGYTTPWMAVLKEKLLTYKYKTDVVLLKDITDTEMAKLVAAAYAILYPVTANIFPLGLLWGIQSGKAVIATDNAVNRQLTDGAQWVDENATAEGFAKAMILVYKDEKELQLLEQQSRQAALQLNRDQMLLAVWACLQK